MKTEYSNRHNQEVESATFQISIYLGDEKCLGCDPAISDIDDDDILYLNCAEYKIVGGMVAFDSATIDR